jgi:hypothetical protein
MRASAVPVDCVITLFAADVSKTFKQVNIHKAGDPDGLPGRVLQKCANQQASVFIDIFNLSLSESVKPTCFKQTTIVPVPKNTKVTCLNDYRPVALTSVARMCFESLVMAHIKTMITETLDPLKFTYRPNRSTYDAISIALHIAISHLDKRNAYVRMLFIDYSSAFNTIVPSNLITKLRTLGLNTSLCKWILDFLMGLPHVVRAYVTTLHHADPQHGFPSGVRAPVLPVHSCLHGHAQLQHHH